MANGIHSRFSARAQMTVTVPRSLGRRIGNGISAREVAGSGQ